MRSPIASHGSACPLFPFSSGDELQRLFREIFLQGLRKLYESGKLLFPNDWRAIEAPVDFEKWLSPLAEIHWVIRLRSVWDRTGPEDADAAARTVEYLARCANRVAISNSRLVAIEGGQVLFRYKDYKDGDQWKTTRMPGLEFIGRFLLHVLPQRFRHIRRFGFLGPRVAAQKLELIRSLLGVKKPAPADAPSGQLEAQEDAEEIAAEEAPRRCRQCNRGELVLVAEVPRPTVAELMRMPPSMEPLADSGLLQLYLPLSALL